MESSLYYRRATFIKLGKEYLYEARIDGPNSIVKVYN